MVLSRTDENELLTALYAGAFEPKPWRLFLSRLRARTEADECNIAVRPAEEGRWHRVESDRRRGGVELDPAGAPFEDLRPGRVYAGDEIGRAGDARARHMRVSWPGGGELGLSILRADGDFRARDSSLLASLAPHLTIALRARTEMERERRRVTVSAHVLGAFAAGWLLLDARGRILDSDLGATEMLARATIMRRAGDGRLRLPWQDAETLLETVLAQPEGVLEPRAEWLSIDPPMQMAILPPPPDALAVLATAHCLIVTRRMRAPTDDGGRFLPGLFRLTRSEAALASRIANGESLAEAAASLGLTLETARNYSKRVYNKTGARGQAELVRIVLDGVPVPVTAPD